MQSADRRVEVDGSSERTPTPTPAPLELQELPEGWRHADDADWSYDAPPVWRRRIIVSLVIVLGVIAAVLGSLVWIGATHYARGVDALEAHAYAQAVGEFSAAKVLFVEYRDARTLEERARRSLAAEEAARAQEEARVQAVAAQLTRAGQRLAAGDAAGTLVVLQAISPGDLRMALERNDAVQAASGSLAADLAAAATTALERAQWARAERLGDGLLVLDPSDEDAATLVDSARTAQELRTKLARASKAAGEGRWRTALRLALAVVAVRKDFPGAAALVADARAALAPKPEPSPTQQAPTAPTTSSGGGDSPETATPPPPPPP